jgi:hypothetical protein
VSKLISVSVTVALLSERRLGGADPENKSLHSKQLIAVENLIGRDRAGQKRTRQYKSQSMKM